MISKKNTFMLWLSFGMFVLSFLVHVLNRGFDVVRHSMADQHSAVTADSALSLAMNILFAIPLLFLGAAWFLCSRRSDHGLIPLLNTLSLTFSSISMVAGGGGTVEFHFSIFMVITFIAYYENIKLIVIMTILFALQHILGFFLFPELVFGVSEYSFVMLLIHAVFLVLTSGATMLQVTSKRKITAHLEKEKEFKQKEVEELLDAVSLLSQQFGNASSVVSEKSERNIASSNDMLTSFKEVSAGLDVQGDSLSNMDTDLQSINDMILRNAEAFGELNDKAFNTQSVMDRSQSQMETLSQQVSIVSDAVSKAARAIQSLHTSSQKVGTIVSVIQDVANRTNLLALNASIEAARAGEHGRGFAVVASEIRKLAEQSDQSAEEIKEILMSVQEESEQSAARIEIGNQAIEDTVQLADTCGSSFKEMNQAVHQITEIVEALNSSVQQIKQKSEGISSEMTNISAVTEESIASVQELCVQSERQLDDCHQINDEITRLRELSVSLQQKFLK